MTPDDILGILEGTKRFQCGAIGVSEEVIG